MAIIAIKGLTKAFSNIQAVAGIDLQIEQGEIFGLPLILSSLWPLPR